MNRQKRFEVDPFSCFRKGHVVRKAVKKVRNPNQGGSFHEYGRERDAEKKKKRDVYGGERKEKSQVASNEQQLGRPCDLEHGRLGDREVPGREVV